MKKSSKSDARFWRCRLKRPFFSQKGGFLGSAWNIFFVSPRCNFVPSFIKIWCADLQISRRAHTHARTDARTDERESIGPSANAERSKTWLQNMQNDRKLGKNGKKHYFVTPGNVLFTNNYDLSTSFRRHLDVQNGRPSVQIGRMDVLRTWFCPLGSGRFSLLVP